MLITDSEALNTEVAKVDLVVSLIPYTFHVAVIKLAIRQKEECGHNELRLIRNARIREGSERRRHRSYEREPLTRLTISTRSAQLQRSTALVEKLPPYLTMGGYMPPRLRTIICRSFQLPDFFLSTHPTNVGAIRYCA
jgi:hypothetical protein